MMKVFITLIICLFTGLATNLMAFSIAGKGENFPVVHSFVDGRYYLRSTPTEDYGTAGKTELYRVTKDGDELVDRYDVYMRGQLFLGWLPDLGKWAIVQLEPRRIVSNDERQKIGDVARLVFYLAGAKVREYPQEDLADMGLVKQSGRLMEVGSFTVQGIEQVPRTNRYLFAVKKKSEIPEPVVMAFDIATGERLTEEQGDAAQPATAVKPKPKAKKQTNPKSKERSQ